MTDFRRRNLLLLGAAALISLGLAGFAVRQQAQEGLPQFAPTEFLPGFAAQVKQAARIHIVSHSGSFDIVYSADKGWVLPQHGDYPADFDEVRHTLIGLATLQTIEPKTALPGWLHDVALDAPPAGDGVLIEVSDAHGKKLASLIAGKLEDIGDANGGAGLFVRRPGENQSWLAHAVFVPHGDIAAWMLSHVMDIDAARLKDMRVSAPGRDYTLSRAHTSDQDYVLTPPAKTANAATLNAIPTVITSFSFSDARPAAGLDFTKGVQVTAHTFDGLTLNLQAMAQGNDVWALLSAAGTGAEVDAINARTKGWAYKLDADKGRLLMIDPRGAGKS